jgi:cytochrome b involved in lipid metabolism
MSGISTAEVAKHATPEDCWIVVNGKVYDLTRFAPSHPGGAESAFPPIPNHHPTNIDAVTQ